QASAQALRLFFQTPHRARSLDAFARSRRQEKVINAQIVESLATQVMTLFEREDVEALSKALYKIPKTVEKIGERILLAPQLLERATDRCRDAGNVIIQIVLKST